MTWNLGAIFIPEETELTAAYWRAARNGQILLQRCDACETTWHPPQPRCPLCVSDENIRWVAAGGQGTVWSFTVVEHAAHEAIRDHLPYVVALVVLDEGPRVITNVVLDEGQTIEIGMSVRFEVRRTPANVSLPVAIIP